MRDPDGNWSTPDTVWDVANIAMGVASAAKNISTGNFGAAADAAGVILDSVAAVIPIVPGGAGATIKAARLGDKAADVVQASNNAKKAVDKGAGKVRVRHYTNKSL
jgi:hypothetical protein